MGGLFYTLSENVSPINLSYVDLIVRPALAVRGKKGSCPSYSRRTEGKLGHGAWTLWLCPQHLHTRAASYTSTSSTLELCSMKAKRRPNCGGPTIAASLVGDSAASMDGASPTGQVLGQVLEHRWKTRPSPSLTGRTV